MCNIIETLGVAFEEDALMALQRDLDSLILPAVPKAQLRDRLGQLRKQCLGLFCLEFLVFCYVLLVVLGVSEQLAKRFNQKPSWNPVNGCSV